MKSFYVTGKDNKKVLDLILLFQYATDDKLTYNEIIIMFSKVNKYVKIKIKDENCK